MELTYIKVYKDFINIARELDNGARGRLFMAILQYANGEELDNLSGAEKIAFLMVKSQIDRDCENYADVVEKRKAAGIKGAEKRWKDIAKIANAKTPIANDSKNSKCYQDKEKEKEKDYDKDTKEIPSNEGTKKSRFLPPSIEEVKAYCNERANSINAEQFVDYYTANGWKVGQHAMKDWKAAVRNWEQREKTKPAPAKTEQHTNIFYELLKEGAV